MKDAMINPRAGGDGWGNGAGREHGLAVLTALTAAEIFGEAGAAQAQGFYTAIGRRLAATVDLHAVRDLDGLSDRVNSVWGACGLGHVRIRTAESGIRVTHRGAPATIEGDSAGHWAALFPALLEGAYDAWFRQLGSGPALVTRIVRHDGDLIELHHGG